MSGQVNGNDASKDPLELALRQAYDGVLDEPVPDRLSALLTPPAPVLDLATARRARLGWAAWGGMAASLLVGLVIGHGASQQPADSLIAQGELASALDQGLSGEQHGNVTLKLSVSTHDGGVCRVFTLGHEASAGLACHEGNGWALRQLSPLPAETKSDYRTASSTLPPELLATVDTLRAGEALDLAAERAVRAKGWSAKDR